jgi:hypothetical protein
MATVNKDFKIKSGLVVEGTTGTIGGHDILTKKQADQDYIIGLIGGTATPDNTPDTVVKRDGDGSFAANDVTVNEISIGSIGRIYDDGDLIIENIDGNDIIINADDIRLNATDDVRIAGNDLVQLTSNNGDIELNAPNGNVYIGTNNDPEYVVVAKGTLDSHIGDGTVDGTAGNTVTDRIATAKSEAIADAGTATDTKLNDYTTTANLDTTVDGYGYLKSADLAGYATESYVDTAEQDAKNYADALINDASNSSTEVWSAYKTNTEIGLAEGRANTYTDEAVADLVNSAPSTLDTLKELADALQSNPDVIQDLQDVAAGKQDTLTAGDNIDITGATISVVGLDSTDISDFATAAQSAGTGYFDPAGAAQTAEDNAIQHANGLATNYDAAGSATLAQAAAEGYALGLDNATNSRINNLDTDEVAEGSGNLYFTNQRALESAAQLLTQADTTNITINGTANGLTIVAENGVADSTTDDLAEGSTNKYFADQLALDAMSNATSVEVQKLDISWVRREEAAYASVATASTATVHSFGTNEGSVKYLVRVYNNNKSHVTEVLATTDSDNNVAVVEYGTIYTSENPLATVTVVWNASSSQYDLNVTTANNNSEVLVAATLLAYND